MYRYIWYHIHYPCSINTIKVNVDNSESVSYKVEVIISKTESKVDESSKISNAILKFIAKHSWSLKVKRGEVLWLRK